MDGITFMCGTLLMFVTWMAFGAKPVTYEMINKAEQVCYINSNTKAITAHNYTVNIECRNGAKFVVQRRELREDV